MIPVFHFDLLVVITIAAVVHVVGFVIMIRGLIEITRIGRAVAGLVYQESERTRAAIRDTR